MLKSEIPKFIILDISDVLHELNTFKTSENNVDSFLIQKDYTNILMDVIEDIATNPSDIQCRVKLDLLLSPNIKNTSGVLTAFGENLILLCCKIKQMIINKIIEFNFSNLIEKEQGFFNYYFKELRGNSVIIQHLN